MSERSISPFERYGAARTFEDAALRVHAFDATDTLSLLADRFYGDWRLWRVIAERNKIVDPRRIAIGFQLISPRRPLETGRYESS